jgi:hypothetical protein
MGSVRGQTGYSLPLPFLISMHLELLIKFGYLSSYPKPRVFLPALACQTRMHNYGLFNYGQPVTGHSITYVFSICVSNLVFHSSYYIYWTSPHYPTLCILSIDKHAYTHIFHARIYDYKWGGYPIVTSHDIALHQIKGTQLFIGQS